MDIVYVHVIADFVKCLLKMLHFLLADSNFTRIYVLSSGNLFSYFREVGVENVFSLWLCMALLDKQMNAYVI